MCWIPYLLLESQHLESLEVCQGLPSVLLFSLLSPARLGPLLVYFMLLPQLLHRAGTSGLWQVGDDPGCKGNDAGGNGLSGND